MALDKLDFTDILYNTSLMTKEPHPIPEPSNELIPWALKIIQGFSISEVKQLAEHGDRVHKVLLGVLAKESKKGRHLVVELVESGGASETLVGDPLPAGITKVDVAQALTKAVLDEPALDAAGLYADPNMVSSQSFASELGVSRQTVNEWRRLSQIIGLKSNRKGFRYPLSQLDAHKRPFSELPAIVEIFGGDHWAAWSWLVAPHAGLDGQAPVDALRAGNGFQVVAAAEGAGGDFA